VFALAVDRHIVFAAVVKLEFEHIFVEIHFWHSKEGLLLCAHF
jgi:hypothetical protein